MDLLPILDALIETAKRTTCLENVYNDETGESFSWSKVKEVRELYKNSVKYF